MKQQRTHTDVHTQTHAKHTHLENLGTIDKWVNVNLNFFHSFEQSTWICFKCFCVGQVGVQLVAPQLLQASPSPQVWGSLLLSGKAGHQMASASHLTAPGSLIFDTVHVCVCVCVPCWLYCNIAEAKRYACNNNKQSFFDPANKAMFLCGLKWNGEWVCGPCGYE